MKRLFLAVLTAAPLFGQYETQLGELEQFVAAEMKSQRMTGLSIAIRKDDFVWAKGFGWADVENRVPASAESSYRLASVTKPMTAVAVLELVEQGKIDLDAEVQKYVPGFPRKSKPVTVRQLLGHLGGISHYRDYSVEGRIREPRDTEGALAVFKDFDLVAEPGTRYNYSSYGYNLLGAVIEGAAGQSYGEFLRKAVWDPLEMNDTRMDDPRAIIPNRVRGYALVDGQLRNSEYIDISSRFAAGGTRSTVLDLIKFVRGMESDKILTAATRDLMTTGLVTTDGTATRYALGWTVTPHGGRYTMGHSGSQQETRTNLLHFPRERFTIALASNFEDANLGPIQDRIALLFLGDSWNANYFFNDRADTAAAWAAGITWNNGLAYYDRYGRSQTQDPGELRDAFRYFNETVSRNRLAALKGEDTLLLRGRHPSAGEPFIKVGSFMAEQLARNGKDLEKYHREGELSFFRDYVDLSRAGRIPRVQRFSREFENQVLRWDTDWDRIWNDRAKRMTVAQLTASPDLQAWLREEAGKSSILPNYAQALVEAGETQAQEGNIPRAQSLAALALELFPKSEAANGFAGVLALLTGEEQRGRTLLDQSARLDPQGYTSERNLLNIARFLDGMDREAAAMLLRETVRLHPESAEAKKMLAGTN